MLPLHLIIQKLHFVGTNLNLFLFFFCIQLINLKFCNVHFPFHLKSNIGQKLDVLVNYSIAIIRKVALAFMSVRS